jgi:4-hydroxy-tetrahydrodipicolinate synthase
MNGVHVPLVTPFTANGALDTAALERLAHHVLDQGAAGLVALGTTGESPMLTEEERHTVIGVCRKASDAYGTPLTVGAGTIGTEESVRQATDRAAEADLLLTLVPYYLRPSDVGVTAHFAAIGAAAGVPLVVYNIPYRTGKTLRVETLLALLASEHVAAVKHCAGSIDADTLTLLSQADNVLCGDDAYLYPMLRLGAAGGILASANVAAGPMVAMVQAVRAGEDARDLHDALLPLVRALFAEPSPSVIKAVLAEQGMIAHAGVRAPLQAPASDSVKAALAALTGLSA